MVRTNKKMKIGINNIFTSFWFFAMISCGGTLAYVAFEANLFGSDLIFIGQFFVGLVICIAFGTFLYLLYIFRLLIVDKTSIVSIHPFLLKKKIIHLSDIKKLTFGNWTSQNGTVFRKVSLADSTTKLSFTDREFENFESLVDAIPNTENKRAKVDLEKAKANISDTNFNVYLLSGFLIFLIVNTVWNSWNSGFHFIIWIFLVCIGMLLYASIKRKLKYQKSMRSSGNTA